MDFDGVSDKETLPFFFDHIEYYRFHLEVLMFSEQNFWQLYFMDLFVLILNFHEGLENLLLEIFADV